MRILWLCNIMLPMIASYLGMTATPKEGWLSGLADRILADRGHNLELAICFPLAPGKAPIHGHYGRIEYFSYHEDQSRPWLYDSSLEGEFREILDIYKPDLVHSFGTEYPHTLAMARALNDPSRLLIGIQGLCFVYADHYRAALPEKVWESRSLRDILKQDSLRQQQHKFVLRGEFEKEALKLAGHITGRTGWDGRHTKAVNPAALYHHMNETLRPQFYGPSWDPASCEDHSIFISQGNYPIKGLHYVLQILPKIAEVFPDIHIYVAGDIITRHRTLKDRLKLSAYGAYLLDLLRHRSGGRSMADLVTFLGPLDADGMLKQYLRSGAFLSPSSIENSPNSLGEAMLLGMPVIASGVGGVPDMIENKREGLLYPAPDGMALFDAIVETFTGDSSTRRRAAALRAAKTHDPEANYKRLQEIYRDITGL